MCGIYCSKRWFRTGSLDGGFLVVRAGGDENKKYIIQTTEYKPNISPNTTHYLMLKSQKTNF